ncbi:hypothetical protein M501DRAFT_926194 [Patellaria atrata CBS 101060]|uniref:BZIP domain-containing protein n=1 Tax=Patellaria atrata CBS 101060 TaxID=1346257 RepID=A0A9P4VS35_9PEZI|nr:hypothetical protein M501DRAFT_926194 [Patellaria atrata CBS 101060]
MATAFAMSSSAPYGNQCFDPSDMESFVDFGTMPSPSPTSSSSKPHMSRSTSAITSPTNTLLPLDGSEDLQTPAKPSHEYERWKQQTGLPTGSVSGLSTLSPSIIHNGHQSFDNSGLGIDDMGLTFGSNTGFGVGSGISNDFNMDVDLTTPSGLPAYFYAPNSDSSAMNDFIDPSAIDSPEEPAPIQRVWPGMHQQQAALAKAQQAQQQQRQKMLQQQRQKAAEHAKARKPSSNAITDARTEETIARVVNQIRQNSQLASNNSPGSDSVLPNIIRMKKDEEDMDEDERLLASEEGKKLSSKERRQLRNKVSARAFRSRRKEYITQLEGEVAVKTNEANELRSQNQALMEENARSRAFIEKLLRHPAFNPFLEDLSRDTSLNESLGTLPSQSKSAAPAPVSARKDINPYSNSQPFQEAPQAHNPQIGMALIPETPVDLSLLNIGTNWTMNSMTPFNYQQPQVFSVLEIPEGPAEPLNLSALSGKESSVEEDLKVDYPVIESAAPVEAEQDSITTIEQEEEEDEEFPLYSNVRTISTKASTPHEPHSTAIFGTIPLEKALESNIIHLVIVDDVASELLAARLEQFCSRADLIVSKLDALL